MSKMKRIIIIYILFLLAFPAGLDFLQEKAYAYDADYKNAGLSEDHGKREKALMTGKKDPGNFSGEIRNIEPLKSDGISIMGALALDLVIPGGGCLYYKNYYYGAFFAALKLASVYSIYYFYNDRRYRASLYFSAKKANEAIDPYHKLYFKSPGGSYKSVSDYKHDYDRASQNIVFSVISCVLVYSASLLLTYSYVKNFNDRAIPAFEFSFFNDKNIQSYGYNIAVCYNYRI